MIIATWINEDRTQAVMLQNDGSLALMERGASYEVWSPPKKLTLESAYPSTDEFITTCINQAPRSPRGIEAVIGEPRDARTNLGE